MPIAPAHYEFLYIPCPFGLEFEAIPFLLNLGMELKQVLSTLDRCMPASQLSKMWDVS